MALPLTATKNFGILTDVYRDLPIEYPALKAITLAQWAYESGWGTSNLANKHLNFAGMKWGQVDGEYGTPWLNGNTKWTSFTSLSSFIHAYWHRLDNVSVFRGWHARATSGPEAFLTYITPGWLNGRAYDLSLTGDERYYVAQVLDIWQRRTKELFLAQETPHENPVSEPAQPTAPSRSWWWPHW